MFREELIPIFLKLLKKLQKENNASELTLQGQYYPDTKLDKDTTEKAKFT